MHNIKVFGERRPGMERKEGEVVYQVISIHKQFLCCVWPPEPFAEAMLDEIASAPLALPLLTNEKGRKLNLDLYDLIFLGHC